MRAAAGERALVGRGAVVLRLRVRLAAWSMTASPSGTGGMPGSRPPPRRAPTKPRTLRRRPDRRPRGATAASTTPIRGRGQPACRSHSPHGVCRAVARPARRPSSARAATAPTTPHDDAQGAAARSTVPVAGRRDRCGRQAGGERSHGPSSVDPATAHATVLRPSGQQAGLCPSASSRLSCLAVHRERRVSTSIAVCSASRYRFTFVSLRRTDSHRRDYRSRAAGRLRADRLLRRPPRRGPFLPLLRSRARTAVSYHTSTLAPLP